MKVGVFVKIVGDGYTLPSHEQVKKSLSFETEERNRMEKNEFAIKIYEMERGFKELGVKPSHFKKWESLIPTRKEVDEALDNLREHFFKCVLEKNSYPVFNLKSITDVYGFIYACLIEKNLSTYVSAKIAEFEKKYSVVMKTDEKIIYLVTDKNKFFMKSFNDALLDVVSVEDPETK